MPTRLDHLRSLASDTERLLAVGCAASRELLDALVWETEASWRGTAALRDAAPDAVEDVDSELGAVAVSLQQLLVAAVGERPGLLRAVPGLAEALGLPEPVAEVPAAEVVEPWLVAARRRVAETMAAVAAGRSAAATVLEGQGTLRPVPQAAGPAVAVARPEAAFALTATVGAGGTSRGRRARRC